MIVTVADRATSGAVVALAGEARALDGVADDAGVLVGSAHGGVDPADLVNALGGGPRRTRALDAAAAAVLHVEQVTDGPGPGVAVQGGVLRGTLRVAGRLAVLPGGHEATVATVHVGGKPVEQAAAGERATIRLDGVDGGVVARGCVLVEPEAKVQPTTVLDVALADGVRPPHGTEVVVHAGSRAVTARIASLGGRFHQLRCEREVLVAPWDRVVVRDAGSPSSVIGGGDVLDPGAQRHGPSRDVLAGLTRVAREGGP